MATCQTCQFANPDAATTCGRCGANLLTSLSALARAAGLPAPMVEPINEPAPVTEPGRPAGAAPKTLLLDEPRSSKLARDGRYGLEVTPPPVRRGPVARDQRKSQGTAPALPGLPGHPMNDPQQNLAVTIPATARADEALQPVPDAPQIKPKLVVLRGTRINVEYPIYEGRNMVGRFADKPVDIDLMSQESLEQIWCSRQHAIIHFERGVVAVEDLNSLNGTWVNGTRLPPKQPRQLKPGDVVQIGTVQMKLVFA
ncbi:fha domain-containing protein : Forkhead-associated protein OS=Oscillochloris trichoides DG-6 GN=OSCT_1182 PE=4 SV=1: FHA [Gemmataceae bacterium]|nr:fha domain-containing protein : Forkhead-associated protein OS=Oscillochloris trichoides DG-6 GN=OSCT_1182 PE=4 SV=1: FHA [Gemmataceae bacterium]VTT96680.1 fha domain-containing protein : Forkhead-associated protein OS=Oscillochloris trichoides DG-6 GN=OSCT_1182 PE=4 SV=1: FHA [Gemmataceae bacterium]